MPFSSAFVLHDDDLLDPDPDLLTVDDSVVDEDVVRD